MTQHSHTAVSWPQTARKLLEDHGIPVTTGKATEGLLWLPGGIPILTSTKIDPASNLDRLRLVRGDGPGFLLMPRRAHAPERAYFATEFTVGIKMLKGLGYR